ncbi:MAG: hypothetical protein FWC27_07160 [Firmicutes bacterium]|nr:hypothetical protein [Bacillota bacterium]
MRLIAKLLSPVLVVVVAQMALISRGIPLPVKHIDTPGRAVNILLPGLLGYGEDVALERLVPYFGGLTGLDFGRELEKRGFETYQADIGPVSGAWDRACELYAQLMGARVDYGLAHSEKYGHERYGRTYEKPLFEGWGPGRPLNLIGHSFGANTARMFALLCDEGDAAERGATPKAELSPLFAGGMIDRVHSITALAGPHNGSTASVCVPKDCDEKNYLWFMRIVGFMGSSGFVNGIYDLQLDHFGMSRPPSWGLLPGQTPRLGGWIGSGYRKAARAFLRSMDHSFYDLSPDGAADFNKIDKIRPSVYYFSYSSVITKPHGDSQLPRIREIMDPFLFGFAAQMGRGTGYIALPDESWKVNDGCVPLPSALYPAGQPHRDFTPGKTEVRPGVWNVMPTLPDADHAYWCGGDPLHNGADEVFGIYLALMERLEGTY